MSKTQLFGYFTEKFDMKRSDVSDFFDELQALSEKELKWSGEFSIPGIMKLVKQHREAKVGRNPATGEQIQIPAKTSVKVRVAKQLRDAIIGQDR